MAVICLTAMPRFESFRGLRYAAGPDLSALACPPYDVIDATERARLSDLEPRNAVHVELPAGHDPYRGAADTLTDWTTEGVLVRDAAPTLYAYRMTPPASSPTFGFVGALGVTDADGLLPHEQTTPKARSDRLDLLRATRINTSPIWALSLARGLAAMWSPSGEPVAVATDPDGVLHEMWEVPSEAAGNIATAVASAPVVVADGHHRWETARNYLREHPGDVGAERVLALVVELSPEELEVRAIHRLVTSLPRGVRLSDALESWFEVVAPEDGEVTLLVGKDEMGLRALPATREAAAHDADAERV